MFFIQVTILAGTIQKEIKMSEPIQEYDTHTKKKLTEKNNPTLLSWRFLGKNTFYSSD